MLLCMTTFNGQNQEPINLCFDMGPLTACGFEGDEVTRIACDLPFVRLGA